MEEKDIFDAFKAADARGEFPTGLSSAELRDLSAAVRAQGVFTARGTSLVFASKIKEVINAVTAGDMDEATARWTLLETLRALGYTPEGGFPDTPPGAVPPAVRGSIEDLSSKRRLDLIIRTQVDLMRGAGEQMRGMSPTLIAAYPCWELVRVYNVRVPRDWRARWTEVGGQFYGGRMIAPKGDPIWGELGSAFDDSLDVDHPPFAFNSGMGWRDVTAAECRRLGVKASDGRSWEEFISGVERPRVLAGTMPFPAPRFSIKKIFPALVDWFKKLTGAVVVEQTITTPAGKEATLERLAKRRAEIEGNRAERMRRALAK